MSPHLTGPMSPVMTPPFLSLTRTNPDGNMDGKTPASYRLLNHPPIFPFLTLTLSP